MALNLDALVETLRKPTMVGVVSDLVLFSGTLCVAVFVGLLVGWAWRPRWAAVLVGGDEEKPDGNGSRLRPSSSGASGGAGSVMGLPIFGSLKAQLPSGSTSLIPYESSENVMGGLASSSTEGGESVAVTTEDLEYLSRLVEVTDGGPAWQQMMDKSLPNMGYQAWRRDHPVGPPQYRSRTVFEDASPETVRDFFWDDEFRMKGKWDDMLIYHRTLMECTKTGTMIVHWVRKFPFFCSNREYIIGRRIWESEGAFYCVTKGVPYPSLPRQNKPRRVDLYYSSWCIRPVESRRGDGQLTATEVLLFHYEDMGIPWEIAKLGIRQGMWGLVKRIEPGLRAYQMARRTDEPHSRCAPMALVNTKVSANFLRSLETNNDSSEIEEPQKDKGRSIPKFLVIGGAVVLACTLDRGLLTKALIFGVARRFAKLGR
uniref:StAR-related lipid transfer protein 7, mitochondrial n=1 Tax=Anthurium amnicola TaxID=1678845 RepID=A0A1D1XR32_9ARAE